jgi:primosomal protein N' (replication factor Y)
VESELLSLFPQVRALRWDAGSVKQKDSHELILSHFTGGRADVLIGTQMLAKSLDLPRVTLVGIVLADAGLNFPDFRASERTFQLLTQVAGRAGRSPLGGRVVLQTFQPEHPAVSFAAKHDFEGYAAWELVQRKQMGYPPFSRLVRMEYRHMDAAKAEAEAQRMAGQLDEWINSGGFSATERIGPVPCYFAREAGQYRWQIVLRGPDPAVILRGRVPQNWLVQVDPVSLL